MLDDNSLRQLSDVPTSCLCCSCTLRRTGFDANTHVQEETPAEDAAGPNDEESGAGKPPLGPSPTKPRPGSRAGSLGKSASVGRAPTISARTSLTTEYSGVPGIDRDSLRASLAKSVLETAHGNVNGNAGGDAAEAEGTAGQRGQALEGAGQRLSWRGSSVETIQRYLALEMTPSVPLAELSTLPAKSSR